MQPEIPTPIIGPERPPLEHDTSVESMPSMYDAKPERENNVERLDHSSEANALALDVGLTSVIPTPVIQSPVADDNDGALSQSSPLVANDDDLIEKEWVDRAKKIVSETQNDPRQRDDRISSLKVDYVKKRFGRELGAAE